MGGEIYGVYIFDRLNMVLSVFDCLFSDEGVNEMDPATLGATFLPEGRCGGGSDGFGADLNSAPSRSPTGAFRSMALVAMTALKNDVVLQSSRGGSRDERCEKRNGSRCQRRSSAKGGSARGIRGSVE